jgi:hypothetical protein
MNTFIERIRAAKDWRERLKLAENKTPGTPFDEIFTHTEFALEMLAQNRTPGDPAAWLAKDILYNLGEALARVISRGDSTALNDMATALNIWKRHKPEPDKALMVLFGLTGLFSRGWKQRWVTLDQKTGKVIRRGLPDTVREKIAMRDIKANLLRFNPKMSEKEWEASRRKILRYAKEFGIELDPAGGRPPKKLRHNRGRRVS